MIHRKTRRRTPTRAKHARRLEEVTDAARQRMSRSIPALWTVRQDTMSARATRASGMGYLLRSRGPQPVRLGKKASIRCVSPPGKVLTRYGLAVSGLSRPLDDTEIARHPVAEHLE